MYKRKGVQIMKNEKIHYTDGNGKVNEYQDKNDNGSAGKGVAVR